MHHRGYAERVRPPPEIVRVKAARVACDGAGDIPAELGHPRVWLEIDESGFADCGYCDRRFVLDGSAQNAPGDIEPEGEDGTGR